MGDLTVRDEQMILLAEQAEAYLEYQHAQRRDGSGGRSAVRDPYDVDGSRREWARQFQ